MGIQGNRGGKEGDRVREENTKNKSADLASVACGRVQ